MLRETVPAARGPNQRNKLRNILGDQSMSQHVENLEMSGRSVPGLSRRGMKGIWQHTRRVPKRYAHLERRKMIRTSLHTQDYHLVLAKALQIEMLQNQEWELATQSHPDQNRWDDTHQRLKNIAEIRGLLIYLLNRSQNCLCTKFAPELKRVNTHPYLHQLFWAPKRPQSSLLRIGQASMKHTCLNDSKAILKINCTVGEPHASWLLKTSCPLLVTSQYERSLEQRP